MAIDRYSAYQADAKMPYGEIGATATGRSYIGEQAVTAPVSAITDAHRTMEEARILAGRVKDIVGRMIGYVPEEANTLGKNSGAIFDDLKCASGDTRQLIGEALQALTRLENQLP